MGCYSPLQAYRSKHVNPSGKRSLVFSRSKGFSDLTVKVPCGQCIGCRLEKSRQWAMRCHHEAKLYENNCFITLTYDDRHLPENGSLVKKDFQLFMKRLRKRHGDGIRFFGCGEYGDKFGRPHYHICLFNFDFSDRLLHSTRGETKYFTSLDLNSLWPFGLSIIGDVTFESAAYVARYVTKKLTGALAKDHYGTLTPEFTLMSRRPGIGRPFLEKYSCSIYPHDSVLIRGRKMQPPKFYDNRLEITSPAEFKTIKSRRRRKQFLAVDDNTTPRLIVKEACAKAKFKQLKRSYEND